MKSRLLLDTNTIIYFFKGRSDVVENLTKTIPSEVKLSSITLYELTVGATTSTNPVLRRQQLQTLIQAVEVIPFTPAEAEAAAQIQAHLQKTGMGIGPLDTLIAGTALAHGLTLVTHNLSEFQRVPGLTCIDWVVG